MDMHDSVSVSVSPHSFSFLDFSTPDSSIFFSMPSLYRITLQMPCSILALFSFQGTGGGRQGVEEGGMFFAKLQPIKFFISFFFFFFYFSFSSFFLSRAITNLINYNTLKVSYNPCFLQIMQRHAYTLLKTYTKYKIHQNIQW